jgi:hypothetical protein
MTTGVYVIHPGEELGRWFNTMSSAREYAVAYDTIVSIGNSGEELGRWTKGTDGNLVQKPKAHHPWRERRDRDTRGTPPPGGRGPDGKPFNPFAVGPEAGFTHPEHHSAAETGYDTGLGPPGADRIPLP